MPPSSTKATVARAPSTTAPCTFSSISVSVLTVMYSRPLYVVEAHRGECVPVGPEHPTCMAAIQVVSSHKHENPNETVCDTKATRVKSFSLPSTRRLRKHCPQHQMVVLWDRILTKLRNGKVPVITNHF
ncbi:hypothetical protein CPB85DRAFT_1439584 [Mucidula mucida]|nr:hypothetical protein CPB85DRAFT_1439584 [Mucidula mucida]